MQDSKTAAAAASAASLIHAAFSNGGIANSAAMAQLFPGFTQLQMAAAAAFGYGGGSGQTGSHQHSMQHQQNAYNLYAAHQQAAQQQNLQSILAAARQQQFLAMQSGMFES